MDPIENLVKIFSDFPGIGPRQAKRFVYYLMGRRGAYVERLSETLLSLSRSTKVCTSCYRFFENHRTSSTICSLCGNPDRDHTTLMLVGRDSDLEAIERTKTYRGLYFVLGGLIPILDERPEESVRLRELEERVRGSEIKEIIFALSATPEGDNTQSVITEHISQKASERNIKISHLGRGISTGTELEYSDTETIRSALSNRT